MAHQLWRGLECRGARADLWVSEYGGWPSAAGLQPMYPRVLNRMQHSRLSTYIERRFPRRKWTEKTFRRLAHSDYDIVHVHGFDGTYAGLEMLIELARSKPVVVTVHGSWWFTGGCGQPMGCERFTRACGECPQAGVWPVPAHDDTAAQLAKKQSLLQDAPIQFISPALHLSAAVARSAVGSRWQIAHIPNGVDPAFFQGHRKHDSRLRRAYGIEPGRFVVLAMCRDFRDTAKGPDLLVDSLRMLSKVNMQVVLAGASGDAVGRRLPSSLNATATGFVASAAMRRDLFELADAFLFTSLAETFPCVVLEAMSAECCVVSTPLPGVKEQITHGNTGLLARSATAADLAEQLAAVCARPSWAREIGRNARAAAQEQFSECQMLDRHLALYERMWR